MPDISERLKALRTSKSVTQSELAEILNLKTNAYQAYERGASKPSCDTLISLADYYGVTTDYLLGISTESEGQDVNIMKRMSERDRNTVLMYASLPDDLRRTISDVIVSVSEHLKK